MARRLPWYQLQEQGKLKSGLWPLSMKSSPRQVSARRRFPTEAPDIIAMGRSLEARTARRCERADLCRNGAHLSHEPFRFYGYVRVRRKKRIDDWTCWDNLVINGAFGLTYENSAQCSEALKTVRANSHGSPFSSLGTWEVTFLKTNSRNRFDTALAPVPTNPLSRTSDAPRSEAG